MEPRTFGTRVLKLFHAKIVVANVEEHGQVEAKNHEHGSNLEESGPSWCHVIRQEKPPEIEKQRPRQLLVSVPIQKLRERCVVEPFQNGGKAKLHNGKSVQKDQTKEIEPLVSVKLLQRPHWVQPHYHLALNIGIQMDIVSVNMVLNHVLMNPRCHTGSIPAKWDNIGHQNCTFVPTIHKLIKEMFFSRLKLSQPKIFWY